MSVDPQVVHDLQAERQRRYEVTRGEDGKKLILPDAPAPDDLAGQCAWVTSVWRLDCQHPATGAVHEGLHGAAGQVEVHRAGTRGLRFEPASRLNTASKLLEDLSWQLLPTDAEPYGFTNAHARTIAHVVRLLCGVSRAPSVVQETAGIVGTFLHGAVAVEGFTTYGQTSQRYDALVALRREREQKTGRYTGDPRFLVDKQTGEFVIRVSDLQAAAREHTGSSVPHGWLDARMEHLGWRRCRLEGYGLLGRAGRRQGPHARADVYRGHLPASPDDDEGVTT